MSMLGLMAFAIPCAWLVVQSYGSFDSKSAMNWPASLWSTTIVIALVPVIMVWFAYLERSQLAQNIDVKQNA